MKKYLKSSFILDIIYLFIVYYTMKIESIFLFIFFCALSLIKL